MPAQAKKRHSIIYYTVAATITVVLGLLARRFPEVLPAFLARYAPDALWASLIYWLMSLAFRRARPRSIAAGAFAFSVAIEISQLYHAPWIDSIRATRLGGLVLGFGFLWSDLACYAAGVVMAWAIDVGSGKRIEPRRR